MTFPALEMTILKFHDFSRFFMTVRTLSCILDLNFVQIVSLSKDVTLTLEELLLFFQIVPVKYSTHWEMHPNPNGSW